MFLKSLPPGLQVLVFILLVIIMAIFGEALFAISINAAVEAELLENVDWSDPRMMLSRVFFSQVFTFLLSFLLILRYTGDRFEDVVQIGRINGNYILLTIAVLVVAFAAMPLLTQINELVRPYLSGSIIEQEIAGDALNKKLFYQDNPIQFVFGLIVMALIPAIFEELVFRGFLITKMMASGVTETGAILLSAAIFAMTHMQPLKFLPMFFMGICLGFVYLKFKNIKYSMLLHFLFNGAQITLGYLVGTGILDLEI